MRLRNKAIGFITSLLVVAGLYFVSLPPLQSVCAVSSDAKCGQGDAVGGRCVPNGSDCPSGYEPFTVAACQSAGNTCCIPLVDSLPVEVKNMQEAQKANILNDTVTRETNANGLFLDIVASTIQEITGAKPLSDGKGGITYSTGAIGTLTNLTAQIYAHPAASSTEYIADVFQNMKHPFGEQTAYAQGLGFSALNPVLSLWKLFRNVAYFFYVIIFMVVGIMIMLRQKIGDKAAVTVQEMLPKLVVSLLLVTFSYAIAGLMLDLMYIGIYLMIGIFQVQTPDGNLSFKTLTEIAFQNNIFQNVWKIVFGGVAKTVAESIGSMVKELIGSGGSDAVKAVGTVVGGATSIITFLIIAIAMLVNVFRIFFALLTAYASIFISVIFAPIQLLMGAVSGKNSFSEWVKGLAKHIVVFPTIILLLFIANYFAFRPGQDTKNPVVGGFSAPQLGSNQGTGAIAAFAMLQFAILALIPKAAEIASSAVDGKFSIDPSKAMGEFAKAGTQGGEIVPGVGFTKFNGAFNPLAETPAEKLLRGSRKFNQEEEKKAQEADWHGATYNPKMGGALSFANKWRARAAARRSGGASREGS